MMIRIPFYALVFTFLAMILGTANGEGNDFSDMQALSGSCRNVTATIKHVTIRVGWPLRLGCKIPFDTSILDPSFPPPPPTTCVITTANKVVFNETIQANTWTAFSNSGFQFLVSSVKADQNGSTYTSYGIRNLTCEAVSYVLNVEQSHQRRVCQNATFYTINNYELYEGRLGYISCIATGAPFYLKNEAYQVKWYKDCQLVKTVDKSGVSNSYSQKVDSYKIANANFSSSVIGEFSCSVTYNGFEMFLTKTKTCVKYTSPGIPLIQHITAPEMKVNTGEDAVITCGGIGDEPESASFIIAWFRYFNGTEKRICSLYGHSFAYFHQPDDSIDQKYECDMLSNTEGATKCFTSAQEAIEDEHKGIYRVNSTLVIKNFADSDVGKYTCRQATPMGPTEATFEISLQTWNPLKIILPSVLGFILLVLLVVLVVICVKRRTREVGKAKVERTSSVSSDMKSTLA